LPDLSKMDIRVGKIVEVWPNPNSEKLYNERINMGNGVIREIASGLQQFIPLDQMKDQLVVVMCNLKPRKLADYMSNGMVLCAETEDNSAVELLKPPAGSVPGDLISFAGYTRSPPEVLPAKKNPWDNVAPRLFIRDDQVACYKDESDKMIAFDVEGKGPCKSVTLKHGIIK